MSRVNKKLSKEMSEIKWDLITTGMVFCGYKHLSENTLVPVAYQCVAKRDMRKGFPQIVLLELCFELSVELEDADDLGFISGEAKPLKGRFFTCEPVVVTIDEQVTLSSTMTVAGIELRKDYSEAAQGKRFRVKKRSSYLRNANGERIFADNNK